MIPFCWIFCYTAIKKGVVDIEAYYEHYYSFIKERALNTKCDSVLNTLYNIYTSRHPVDCDQIQALFHSADDILCTLSAKRRHRLLRLILDICTAYERLAFIEGAQVGVQLGNELTNQNE